MKSLALILAFLALEFSFGQTLRVPEYNLLIKDCESYPYYSSLESQTGGNENLKEEFFKALKTAKSCTKTYDFRAPVKKAFQKFFSEVTGSKEKVLTCNYGVTYSYFAVASDPEVGAHEEQANGLPPHPSVIFDTNRMAGNFPVGISQQQRENFVLFYGGRLTLEQIVGGSRNPFLNKIEDSVSLVFHEMFHWTGHSHFPKENLDLVYLSQFCCFPQDKHSAQDQALACELLEDAQAWQDDDKKRVEYIKENGLQEKVKALISKYH